MTKTYKRALTNAQAAACENAKHPKCRCRCGGALHGKGHADYQAQERELLDKEKELTSEQIPELIKSLPLTIPSNDANTANGDNHDNHNPRRHRLWSTINRDNQEIGAQGRLPLEVA